MGRRINYFKNNFEKSLKNVLLDNYVSFRQWYLDTEKSSLEEFDEDFGNQKLKDYFKKGNDLSQDFEHLDKQLINELTAEFIKTDYCWKNKDNFEFFGPTMSVWRYEESTKMVLQTNDQELIKLWQFLTQGRSLKDNSDFESYTNEYKIGFLDKAEYQLLKKKIEHYFGNIETIRQQYWTASERAQLERALKDKSFALTDHNPKSSGLEYILSALNDLTSKNKNLITGIE